ncbi:Phosphotransferase enzyme [Microsporum audouinii]
MYTPILPTHTVESGEHPFFNYTSGRWLWDEETQLQKRSQRFNIRQLQERAVRCASASSCTSMVKLQEGLYNKAFLLSMDNGVQVVARIPNPYLPPRVATASEVATLDFLRNELDLPVPKVLAWSSDKDQPVGTEYIIMEKAPGEELGKSWSTLSISERVGIVSQLVKIQATLSSVDMKHYGSLYYSGEEGGHESIPGVSDRFCIGPSSAIRFWEEERMSMAEYRGPWSSPLSYAKDIAKREMNWIRKFAKPRDLSDPLRQSTSQESPSCHLQLLSQYLKIVSQTIPLDKHLNRATLWHSDLHSGNIFIKDNKIVSIIDWQGCMSVPLFMAARIPKFLKFDGPMLFDLPSAANLTEMEKKETLLRYELTQLQGFYVSKFQNLGSSAYEALSYPYATIRQQLIDLAGFTWEDEGLFFFREMLHRIWHDWGEISNQPAHKCPIEFDPDELSSHAAEKKGWNDYKALFESLGISNDGWVHSEDFGMKAKAMRNLAMEILNSSEDREEARRALIAWKLSDPTSTHLSPKVVDV